MKLVVLGFFLSSAFAALISELAAFREAIKNVAVPKVATDEPAAFGRATAKPTEEADHVEKVAAEEGKRLNNVNPCGSKGLPTNRVSWWATREQNQVLVGPMDAGQEHR